MRTRLASSSSGCELLVLRGLPQRLLYGVGDADASGGAGVPGVGGEGVPQPDAARPTAVGVYPRLQVPSPRRMQRS